MTILTKEEIKEWLESQLNATNDSLIIGGFGNVQYIRGNKDAYEKMASALGFDITVRTELK